MSVLPISTVSKASRRESLISTNTVPNLTITADDHQRESSRCFLQNKTKN